VNAGATITELNLPDARPLARRYGLRDDPVSTLTA
jgi:hypothetical protein